MDNNLNIIKARERKFFEKKDILVYSLIIVLIASLFLAFYLGKINAQGFKVTVNGSQIISHNYGGEFNVSTEWQDKIQITKEGDGYSIRINFVKGYNQIFCNEKTQSVKMLNSDCPSKNCVHMKEISNAGAIYCAPRDLKILPISDSGNLPPNTGGVG